MNHSRKSGLGFTLIEVLVALIILSIGLLGVAALMIKAVKSNDSANMSSQAIVLANSMLDNIRANFSATNSTAYQINQTCSSPGTTGSITQTDLSNWLARIASNLPAGCGQITIALNGSVYVATITVQWNDIRAASVLGGPDNNTITVTSIVP